MTFYVLLPFYAALTGFLARGRETRSWVKTELLLLIGLAAVSLFLGGPPFTLRSDDWFRFSALGHFYWFALGLALAVVSVVDWKTGLPKAVRAAASKPALCWAAAAAIYLFTVLAFYPAPFIIAPFRDGLEYTTLNLIQGVAAVLLFVPAVFGNPNRGLPSQAPRPPGADVGGADLLRPAALELDHRSACWVTPAPTKATGPCSDRRHPR